MSLASSSRARGDRRLDSGGGEPSTPARAGGRPGRTTTVASAAGATSTSARRAASSRPRSSGSTAGAVAASAPRWSPGRGRARATPGTSKTSSATSPSERTRRRSAGCCGRASRPWPTSSRPSSPKSSTTRALNDLYRIGVDEVSYRKGHRYLTVVADHDRAGAVIWVSEGKDAKTLLGLLRRARSRAQRLGSRPSAWTWAGPTRRRPTTRPRRPASAWTRSISSSRATRRSTRRGAGPGTSTARRDFPLPRG